jgi:hypothetical protein
MKIIVTVRGRLKGDQAQAQHDHDATVDQLSQMARPIGATGHRAYLDPQDHREFLAIDSWANMDGLQKFMSDPNVAVELGKLFEGQPQVSVWVESGWRSFED